jgi:hypothetical protein
MGYTSTTNMLLRKTVDTSIIQEDFENLQTDVSSNVDALEAMSTGSTVIGTNASIVNTAGKRFVQLYACSAGSISTITGMLTNVPFTLMMMSSGASLALVDASPVLIAGNWVGATTKGNITLVWDGTNYVELGRVAA